MLPRDEPTATVSSTRSSHEQGRLRQRRQLKVGNPSSQLGAIAINGASAWLLAKVRKVFPQLADAVLELVITEALFHEFSEKPE